MSGGASSGEPASVVIPTYYRNARLRQAIESVKDQTYEPVEIIVVDGSGEAHARPVASEYEGLVYIAQDADEGPHAARSVGAEHATGAYIQFLDDDDRLRPAKLARQISRLERTDKTGVVYCGIETENGSVERPDPSARGDVLAAALAFTPSTWMTSTLLIERSIVDSLLPLPNRHGADDMGLRIELARRTAFDFVAEPLVRTGEPPDSLGTSWRAIDGRWTLLERYADLYDEHPPWVRNAAMAEIYRRVGRRSLEERPWSLRAIVAFARAAYYAPEITPLHVGEFLSSLAGRPGRRLAARLR